MILSSLQPKPFHDNAMKMSDLEHDCWGGGSFNSIEKNGSFQPSVLEPHPCRHVSHISHHIPGCDHGFAAWGPVVLVGCTGQGGQMSQSHPQDKAEDARLEENMYMGQDIPADPSHCVL